MPNNTISDNLIRLNTAKNDIATAIIAKGGTVGSLDGFEDFAEDIASITNQYTVADEGKVVSGGALVSQTDYGTVTENGTYDTTLNNQVSVNVAGASSPLTFVQILPNSATISSIDLYISNCGSYTCVFGHLLVTVSSISFTGYTVTFSYPETFSPTHTTRKTATAYDVTSESYDTSLNISINTSNKSCVISFGVLSSGKTFDLYITALLT